MKSKIANNLNIYDKKQSFIDTSPKDWIFCELDGIIQIQSLRFNPLENNESKLCIELEHITQETGEIIGFVDAKSQLSIKNLFFKGQILFGKLRPYLKKYWKAQFDGVCSSEIWVFDGKKVSNDFLFYFVQTNKFIQIANVSSGSKMPRADWAYMKEIPFLIPSLWEQEKIAKILSAADCLIQNTQALITQKEKYKKGLCQKLFFPKTSF